MTSSGRNRSEGWRHAKIDGHKNESDFGEDLSTNREYLSLIENAFLENSPAGIPKIEVDGSKHVPSIFGDSTTSKVDIAITWPNGERINLSVKKSLSGQSWLVTVPRFFAAIEHHLGIKIPKSVKAGISLFIGGSNLQGFEEKFKDAMRSDEALNKKMAAQERHQRRLVAESLKRNHPEFWFPTLEFFNSNIELITELSYSHGVAASDSDSADLIVYNHTSKKPDVFVIKEIVKKCGLSVKTNPVTAGPNNGGSTLLLPTGRVQMHHPNGDNQLQFRHEFEKIANL